MNKFIFVPLFIFSFSCLIMASEDSEKKFKSAMSFYDRQEMPEAISAAKEAIALDPNVSTYYAFIGNIHNYLKQYDEGEKYFKQSLKINPNDPGALNGLGEVFSYRGLLTKSIEMYKKSMKFAPDFYGVYINIAMDYIRLYERKKNFKDLFYAKENLEKSITLNDKAYDAYGYLGKVCISSYDYENAAKYLEKSISLNPNPNRYFGDFGDTYFDLGSAYYNLKRYKEAINAFQESLKIKPNAPDAILALGASYVYAGDIEKAVEKKKELETLDPGKALILSKTISKRF